MFGLPVKQRESILTYVHARMLLVGVAQSVLLLSLLCQGTAKLHPGSIGEPPGPWVWPSRGQVWPKPQKMTNVLNYYLVVRTNTFKFKTVNETCDILVDALHRYYRVLVSERDAALRAVVPNRQATRKYAWLLDPDFRGYLDVLEINLTKPCEKLPYLGMNEQYELRIDSVDLPGAGKLTSQSVWGILRGLETFVQLVAPTQYSAELHVRSTSVTDFPRFAHRGLMVDTARHFHPLPVLLSLVDGMEASKLNTLHWHLVDDQAFPFQSKVFPELSEKGAYHPLTHVYTQQDIKTVIEYCRMRGVRVIPEFDSPGHTRSWGQSHPEILTTCYTSDDHPDGSYGPLDPTKEETYDFVKKLFTEIHNLFPEKYFHLGGDEVDFKCWQGNAKVRNFMAKHGIAHNYKKLEELYISRVINMTEQMGSKSIVWQEVFDNGLALSKSTIVQVWMGGVEREISKITASGHLALLSSCWYLDHDGSWEEFYDCDPHSFGGTPNQQKLVLGGEACLWSEWADGGSISQRVFPRASVMAERLWSDKNQIGNIEEASPRIDEFRCRLLRRGVAARPVTGPGFCPGEVGADWPELKGLHKIPDPVYLREQDYKLRMEYKVMLNAM